MQDSKIEWTNHTFNPWRGCTKVSEGCTHCYAETLSHRNPSVLGFWGDAGTRVIASESAWGEPIKWDRKAKKAGERHRVFCASLADVFENREELVQPRERLFATIQATPGLDWLLLTKRPQNIASMATEALGWDVATHGTPPNIWLGTSVENRKHGLLRIDRLRKIPATIRFLSVEPLLEDLGEIDLTGIHWVIVGGESGHGARPMHPDWVRAIRDQCVADRVPFFFKQWGDVMSVLNEDMPEDVYQGIDAAINLSGYGGNPWFRVGKKRAGRMLDGREWSEFPVTNPIPEVA
jgi:protein gp37